MADVQKFDSRADSAPFSGSAAVFDWLARFINLERGRGSEHFPLSRMEKLAALAGNPERFAPVIHVAGSKGKGSVTGMIAAMLGAWGLRTARYTSPHVTEYRERITLGNDFFDESVYIAAGEKLRRIVRATGEIAESRGEEPAFFELLTLYFFLCARQARCEAMVVETGMGGRLDATNIVDPLVSVITSIELEHTEYLGDTVSAIAGEKAGIIKRGRPLILMEQVPEALEVFRREAARRDAPLRYFPEAARIDSCRVESRGTFFSLTFNQEGLFPAPLDLSIPIPGEIQGKNAGLATLAIKTAFPEIGVDAIRQGLEHFRLPARFERILEAPPVIIDGAHTPRSVEFCLSTFRALYGGGGILLFACVAGKDDRTMARVLLPHFSRIIISAPGTFKKSFPEEVYRVFQGENSLGAELVYLPDTLRAIEAALKLRAETGLPVLGTGSFYLAAEIRNRLIDGSS
jgi:dihydrofolate synthase/folylpolyglutamate synthase